jgi:sporulation protein YlmC with PRC-barrel domain
MTTTRLGSTARPGWELHPGAAVICADGRAGVLDGVGVDPRARTVARLIVRQGLLGGRLVRRWAAAPAEALTSADRHSVRLACATADLAGLPGYPPAAEAGAPGERALRAGMPVVCVNGRAGTLRSVLLDPATRRVTHLIVGQGAFGRRELAVPIEWVARVEAERIALIADRLQLDLLPDYRPSAAATATAAGPAPAAAAVHA